MPQLRLNPENFVTASAAAPHPSKPRRMTAIMAGMLLPLAALAAAAAWGKAVARRRKLARAARRGDACLGMTLELRSREARSASAGGGNTGLPAELGTPQLGRRRRLTALLKVELGSSHSAALRLLPVEALPEVVVHHLGGAAAAAAVAAAAAAAGGMLGLGRAGSAPLTSATVAELELQQASWGFSARGFRAAFETTHPACQHYPGRAPSASYPPAPTPPPTVPGVRVAAAAGHWGPAL